MEWIGYNLTRTALTPVLAVAGLYAAEDCVGTLMTSSGPVTREGGYGTIRTARIADRASQIHTHGMELYVFRDLPVVSTFTDNGAFAVDDTEFTMCLGSIHFNTSAPDASFGKSANNQWISVRNINFDYRLAVSSLYFVLKTPGTPTYADGDLHLELYSAKF